MSDALLSGSQAAGPKLAAVWQPAPVLKALANQRFVRVKDARGHTSHFTLSSYQHLEQAATSKVQEAAKATPTEGASAPISRPDNLDLPDSDLAELANEPLRIIKKREYAKGLSEGRRLTLEKLKKQEEEKMQEWLEENSIFDLEEDGWYSSDTEMLITCEPVIELVAETDE